ncbi:hypothetical protein AB4Y45_16340 [Paraburkholderia sp. EG287A]|uniref:hypothetical protein n=1 Tax=unclassified Paraburkholderia TaxID=2615204 RepID=UPI0034D1AB67
MLLLLSLHPIAAQRGDGLRPELLAPLRRQVQTELSASFTTETEDACEPVLDLQSSQALVVPVEAAAATSSPPASIAHAA